MVLKAGELDRRISIEQNTPTRDAHGEPIASWSRIGRVRWARYRPLLGAERFGGDQFIAQEQVEFLVRWSLDLAALSPTDRVVFTVTDDTPEAQTIYDIMAVHEVGRREGLRIMTARRAEQ